MWGRHKQDCEVCGGKVWARCGFCGHSPEMIEEARQAERAVEEDARARGIVSWGSCSQDYKRFCIGITTTCPSCGCANTEAHNLWPLGAGCMTLNPFVVFCQNGDCGNNRSAKWPGYGILVAFYDGNIRGYCTMDSLYPRICQHPRFEGGDLAAGQSARTPAELSTEAMAFAAGNCRL